MIIENEPDQPRSKCKKKKSMKIKGQQKSRSEKSRDRRNKRASEKNKQSTKFSVIKINNDNNNNNSKNYIMHESIKQLQGSFQSVQQQLQQSSLNIQLLMGKYDAEIGRLASDLNSVKKKLRTYSQKVKTLKAQVNSRDNQSVEKVQSVNTEKDSATSATSFAPPTKPKERSRSLGKPLEDPFQCTVCRKIYKWKSSLAVHQKKSGHGLQGDNSIADFLNATGASSIGNSSKDSSIRREQSESENYTDDCNMSAQTEEISFQIPTCSDETPNVQQVESADENLSQSESATSVCEVPLSANRQNSETKFKTPGFILIKRKKDVTTNEIIVISDDDEVQSEIIKKEFSCPSCDSSFDQELLLTEHMRSSCSKFRPCPICGKKFLRKRSLKNHLETHGKKEQKLHKCPSCDKSFSCASNLQVHKELHLNERPHECLQCGKRFRKQNSLQNHCRNNHENALKLFRCALCSKSFENEIFLEKHSRTHPVCSQCEAPFRNNVDLGIHVKQCYIRRRSCDYCRQELDLTEWKEHSKKCQSKSKQSVVCFYCGWKCSSSTGLKRHVKSKHPGLRYKKA